MSSEVQVPPRVPLFSNPVYRALLYQALVLGSCAAAFAWIFRNTLVNLQERGIASGFGFLANEAGFGISEVLPIPLLEGGFLAFLGSVAVGLVATWGVAYALKREYWKDVH